MRYDKNKIEQKKLKKLYRSSNRYYSGVSFQGGRYKREHDKPDDFATYMKKYNNRRLRQFHGELNDGNHYRKVNEHWWIIL